MKNTILKLSVFFAFLFCFGTNAMAQEADGLVGLWLPSNGKARVNIYKAKDGKYYGRIVWLKEPNDPNTGKPKVDKNNPDESKRNTPLLGYLLLQGFEYKGDKLWENGTIYDPESGSTYSCKVEMPDANTMEVRGFIGVSLFGKTDTWKRLQVKTPATTGK
jgi:uncharacterized protein (DUF2147 family)